MVFSVLSMCDIYCMHTRIRTDHTGFVSGMITFLVSRHAKRLFLSGNWDLDSKMSEQFIWTNLLNKGL